MFGLGKFWEKHVSDLVYLGEIWGKCKQLTYCAGGGKKNESEHTQISGEMKKKKKNLQSGGEIHVGKKMDQIKHKESKHGKVVKEWYVRAVEGVWALESGFKNKVGG